MPRNETTNRAVARTPNFLVPRFFSCQKQLWCDNYHFERQKNWIFILTLRSFLLASRREANKNYCTSTNNTYRSVEYTFLKCAFQQCSLATAILECSLVPIHRFLSSCLQAIGQRRREEQLESVGRRSNTYTTNAQERGNSILKW